MGNVLDYVRREFRGFAELPFGDVDSLVCPNCPTCD